jgi:hypothetical protein
MTDKIRACKNCNVPKPETADHYSTRINKKGVKFFRPICRACRRTADRSRVRDYSGTESYSPPTMTDRVITESSKLCSLCANQSWRVVGPRCRGCMRIYQDEPKVELITHRHFERAI